MKKMKKKIGGERKMILEVLFGLPPGEGGPGWLT
jgi:hypothetical protein